MKFVFAPDSFKGTLSSEQQIALLKQAAEEIFPGAETVGVPIADGGEGTIRAVYGTAGGRLKCCQVTDPLGETIEAEYLILDDDSVLIEMAQASGITLIPYKSGNAGKTTSYGTGELIKDALKNGYQNITVSIGGSATNDGGAGMLAALGVKFYDRNGKSFIPVGETLQEIERIDSSNLMSEVKKTSFCVMCDVTTPLLGSRGATYVFGPQKGADEKQLERLETGMRHYAALIEKICGYEVSKCSGAGAAGGMGAALLAFCNARLQSGIRTILKMVDFEAIIADADLILTGEGRIDGQSACGKVLDGIGFYAKKQNLPVLALAGSMGEGAETVYACGIDSIMTTQNRPMELEEALEQAEDLYRDAAKRMFRILRAGIAVKK